MLSHAENPQPRDRSRVDLKRTTCADAGPPNGLCEDGGWIGDQPWLLRDAEHCRLARSTDKETGCHAPTPLGYDCTDVRPGLSLDSLARSSARITTRLALLLALTSSIECAFAVHERAAASSRNLHQSKPDLPSWCS